MKNKNNTYKKDNEKKRNNMPATEPKHSAKGFNTIKTIYNKYQKPLHCAIIVVLLVIIVLLFFKTCNRTEPPKEFIEAEKTMRKQLNKDFPTDWYERDLKDECEEIFKLDDKNNLVYVDFKNCKIVIGETELEYEKFDGSYDIIKAKDEQKLKDFIEKQLGIPDTANNLYEIADSMGALKEYVEKVSIKKVDRDHRILSLIYNTAVGDKESHMYIILDNKKLKIVRACDHKLDAINVKIFSSAVQNLSDKKCQNGDINLLQILVENRALDTNVILNVAYYDLRNDCVRYGNNKAIKISDDEALFNKLIDTLTHNPKQLYIYDEENKNIIPIDINYLNPKDDSCLYYTNVNEDALETAKIKESHPETTNGIFLLLGLVMGLVLYPILTKDPKNNAKKTTYSQTDVLKQNGNDISPIIQKIKNLESYNEIELDDQKLSSIVDVAIKEYKQSEEYQNLELQAQKPDKSTIINEFKKSDDYKRQANDAQITKLLRDNKKDEAKILDLLEKYIDVKIHTFQDMKENNPGITAVIKYYDKQTKHNLTNEVENLILKAQWYDQNKEIAVSSINSFRQKISYIKQGEDNRKKYLELAMNELAMPILGDRYKDIIENILKEDTRIADEAKVYRLIIGTRSNYDKDSFLASLKKDIEDEDLAIWLGALREFAKRYTEIRDFSDMMWEKFIQEFIEKEPNLSTPNNMEDKGWYFSMLMNIAYLTVDHIRFIKQPDQYIFCYNKKVMDKKFNMKEANVTEFAYNNILKSTDHTNTIYEWATESGVRSLYIVVDNFAILPPSKQ